MLIQVPPWLSIALTREDYLVAVLLILYIGQVEQINNRL